MKKQKGIMEIAADKVWKFFSSVKLAVALLIILAIVSIIGTVIQQNEAPEQYLQEYSQSTIQLFDVLGFFDMYHTKWFVLLLFMLTTNLTICSLERFPYTWKIIKTPMKILDDDDFNSEGLLLLTNDGEIARRLELPVGGWTRKYRARLFGKVSQADLDKLAEGVTLGGVKYGPVVADLERSKGMNSWASVTLKEGKNREVKRVMESLGLRVARLIRVQFGPFHLGQLAEGAVEEIPAKLWREHLGIGRKKRDREPT